MLVLLMGKFMNYPVEMGVRCHYIHTKFHKSWFRHLKGNLEGYTYRHTDSKVISLAYF
jgi:hypothetical protein